VADRTVLITGASGGLGQTVAAAFVANGWRVVAPAIEAELDLGDGIVVVPGTDLTDVDSVGAAVAVGAAESSAPLRAVVNLVGGYAGGSNVADSDPDEFDKQFRVNLRPTYLVTRAALPHLVAAGGGSIVCVSSRAAVAPFAGAAGYIASKAAVIAFAQAVAVEYRGDGVRCNAILPSVIDTPANRSSQPDADYSKWVTPVEIAGVIVFLAGDASRPTSGAAIPVYGRA
jgi:NAD(P)-dependent dehydrogenase (short-subunit alcohol dehydrogenase family)